MTTTASITEQVDAWIALLRESQQRLAETVATLDEHGVRADSYDDDWSIAQVLSHLGSQSEVYGLVLDAAISGGTEPGREQNEPIWDEWNAKDPMAQVRDAIAADAVFLDRVVAIPDDVREGASMELFGARRTLTEILSLRVAEHVMHTWDVVVALDPGATLQSSAVGPVLDQVLQFLGFMGKVEQPRSILVRTVDPDRTFVLSIGPDAGSIDDDTSGPVDGSLTLPAEAFVRLLYGRLDPAHRPSIETDGVTIDELTPAFPGF